MLLFSATFPPRIVQLALEFMQSPVRVAVGKTGVANENIQQDIVVLRVGSETSVECSPSDRRSIGCVVPSVRWKCEGRF